MFTHGVNTPYPLPWLLILWVARGSIADIELFWGKSSNQFLAGIRLDPRTHYLNVLFLEVWPPQDSLGVPWGARVLG